MHFIGRFIIVMMIATIIGMGQTIRFDQLKGFKNRVINVVDYGAKGDGSTNDTVAIRAALAAGAGKTVYFPAGTYKVTDVGSLGYVLNLSANTSIVGASEAVGSTATSIVSYTTNVPLIRVAADNVSVKNLYLLQSGTATSGSMGIRVYGGVSGCWYGSIENVLATGFYDGFYIDGTPGLFNVTNISARNSVSHGIVGLNSQGFWRFIDAQSNVGSGIYLGSSALAGGVNPWMDTVHTYANGRYGLESPAGFGINLLSNFYGASNSLGDIYSNTSGTFSGQLTNIRTEYTGLNPWSGHVGVTAATNANPIEITTSAAHGFSNGASVDCSRVLGNTAANGTFTITWVSSTKFTLNGTTGNGVYAPTAGCISSPMGTGCARCSLATATYRSLPTAPAISIGSSNTGISISNAHIYSPNGEALLNQGTNTSVSGLNAVGGGGGGVVSAPYGIKSTGVAAIMRGINSNTSCYISGSQTTFTSSKCLSTTSTAAMEIASGTSQILSDNLFYSSGAGNALTIQAGVTSQRANNIAIGVTSDSSAPSASSITVAPIITYAQMVAQSSLWGICSNCKPTSGVDSTCTNGGTGAMFFFDPAGAWRCVK